MTHSFPTRRSSDLRIADFDEDLGLCQPILQFDDAIAEFGAVENGLAVGIVEDVEHLLGAVAIVDVHMGEPAFEAGRHQFAVFGAVAHVERSEEHTSELQSLMRISYAVFCLKKKNIINKTTINST